jgi:signal transduction histidine kinase
VFERHFSAHGELTKGIGLSIVRAVANSHHGNVRAEDNHPQGASLVIRLPLESSHSESK